MGPAVLIFPAGHPGGAEYRARAVAEGRRVHAVGWLHRMESRLYRAAGIEPAQGMDWKTYAVALLVFNAVGALAVYLLQRVQAWLPLNPQGLGNVGPDSAFNTAVSFVSNTNWQGYSGEQAMSYLTQMLALTCQNFFSAATGIAVVFALIRGFSTKSARAIGNFWVDITRSILYVLLPLSLVFAVFLMGQGVIQNFSGYQQVHSVELHNYSQTIAMGPVASQEAIKMLGTNGGGFFGCE